MVAVALLPPLVTSCMLGVQGHGGAAGRAALLLLTNVVSVNLAAVTVFRLRGVRPRTWWEGERATRATRWALAIWILLLGVIVALVFLAGAAPASTSAP